MVKNCKAIFSFKEKHGFLSKDCFNFFSFFFFFVFVNAAFWLFLWDFLNYLFGAIQYGKSNDKQNEILYNDALHCGTEYLSLRRQSKDLGRGGGVVRKGCGTRVEEGDS